MVSGMPNITSGQGKSITIRIYEKDKAEFDALVWTLTQRVKRPVTQGQVMRWLLDIARESPEGPEGEASNG